MSDPSSPPMNLPEELVQRLKELNLTHLLNNISILAQAGSAFSYKVLDKNTEICLILIYTIMSVVGVIGNGLVCYIIAKDRKMQTNRNLFIINLAVSDLTLCLFTSPFTLINLIYKNWIFGGFTCKLVASFQATNVFVSTLSITSIAVDRYFVIVSPISSPSLSKRSHILLAILFIWCFSFLCSSPAFLYNDLLTVRALIFVSYQICYEKWPSPGIRKAYSLCSTLFQYLLPISTVSIVYFFICRSLHIRNDRKFSINKNSKREALERRREKRTNILLGSIVLIFALSWLPLNLFHLLDDLNAFKDTKLSVTVIFAFCHLAGMSSACTNPILYGWLNENFKRNEQRSSLNESVALKSKTSAANSNKLKANHTRQTLISSNLHKEFEVAV